MQRQISKKYFKNLLCSKIMNEAHGKSLMLETAKVFPGKKRKGYLATSQQLPYYMSRNVSLAATADKLVPD